MEKTTNNLKLGIFVTLGTGLLIAALYLIGSKRNLFNETIAINIRFHNVNGLMKGNNVRFAGINIGTVQDVNIYNDSTVIVSLVIEKDAQKFIRKTSVADIGSDGLMGNKLINLTTKESTGEMIKANDTLTSLIPVATDEMMRTLNTTNGNVLDITNDLKNITKKINSNDNIWNLLGDTVATDNIRNSLAQLKISSENANKITATLEQMMKDVQAGNGTVGMLMNNAALADTIKLTLDNLKAASDTAKLAMHHMHQFMKDLNITPGPLGVLARDTAMANDMKSMIHNLNKGTELLNENMVALHSNFLFKNYFKKKTKSTATTPAP